MVTWGVTKFFHEDPSLGNLDQFVQKELVHVGSLVSHASNLWPSQHGSRSHECKPWRHKSNLLQMAPAQLVIFHWETGRRMYDAFSVIQKKLEPERACTLCTCVERSKHLLRTWWILCFSLPDWSFGWTLCFSLPDWSFWLAPYYACTCGKTPKHFIEDMNFETRQCCETCPPSKQNKTRFTCQLPTMGSTCLHWSLSSFLKDYSHPWNTNPGWFPPRQDSHVVPKLK